MSSLQSLDRAIDILNLIQERGGKMSVSSIADIMSLHKSTVHRTLNTMLPKGFISKDATGLYTIGPKVLILGLSAANNLPISNIGKPYMAFLSEKYKETVSISVTEGLNVFILSHLAGDYTTTFFSSHEKPLSCDSYRPAVTHCLLAFSCELTLDNKIILEYLDRIVTSRFRNISIDNPKSLVSYLKKIKEQGYSFESGEYLSSEACYCVPIMGDNNKATATLSIHGDKSRLSVLAKQELVKDLQNIAASISEIAINQSK